MTTYCLSRVEQEGRELFDGDGEARTWEDVSILVAMD